MSIDYNPVIHPVHAPPPVPVRPPCANCDAPRLGEYCHACGQHFLDGRLTIRRLVRDFVVRKLGLEGGLLRTVTDLTVRPGAMIRDYVNGRRQRYTNPVAYLLITASAYLLLAGAWNGAMADGLRAQDTGLQGQEAESLVQVQLYFDAHPALTTLFLCLFLVPILRLLFRRSTTVAEASVFSLYVSGHLLLMQIVVNLGALLLADDVYGAMTGWPILGPTAVLMFAAGRFFGTRLTSYLKVAVALVFTMIALAVSMYVVAMIVSELASLAPAAAAS